MMKNIVKFMLRYQRWVYTVSIVFLVAILVCPLIFKAFDKRIKYQWNDYFSELNPTSGEPFGLLYVDEYLKDNWKGKYEISNSFLGSMKKNSKTRCNYLVYDCDGGVFCDTDSIDLFVNTIKKGSNFIFACSYKRSLSRYVGIEEEYNTNFYISDFTSENSDLRKITIGKPTGKGRKLTDTCSVWNNMINDHLHYNSHKAVTISYENDVEYDIPQGVANTNVADYNGNSIVMTVKIGNGKAMFNGSQALFNNYAISQPLLWSLNKKIMNETFDKSLPLVIIYKDYEYDEQYYSGNGNSMFSVLLQNPSTALALYILLFMLLLWMLVNSRRRRRAEKTDVLEHNSSVSYVEHLATLYTVTSDYKELLELEQRKLLYSFRKEYRFDITAYNFTLPSEYSTMVAKSKGYDETKVREALLRLESLTGSEGKVGKDSYTQCMKLLIEALRKKD